MSGGEQENKLYQLAIVVSAVFTVALISFYFAYRAYTANTGFEPTQPLGFSHKKHSGEFRIKCLYCHYGAESSPHSSIPTTEDCMVCHIALNAESELMAPVNASYDDEKSLIWSRVYRLPDFVRYTHSAHIRVRIDCSNCHGEVEKYDSTFQYQPLTMLWCLDCHRDPERFITTAREISGIFTYIGGGDNNTKTLNDRKGTTEPFFGSYIIYGAKPLIEGVPMPRRAAPAAENCSSCHY